VALSLDDEHHAWLKEFATRNHWSMATAARVIVQDRLDTEQVMKETGEPES
jgi:plasmid stability protein